MKCDQIYFLKSWLTNFVLDRPNGSSVFDLPIQISKSILNLTRTIFRFLLMVGILDLHNLQTSLETDGSLYHLLPGADSPSLPLFLFYFASRITSCEKNLSAFEKNDAQDKLKKINCCVWTEGRSGRSGRIFRAVASGGGVM